TAGPVLFLQQGEQGRDAVTTSHEFSGELLGIRFCVAFGLPSQAEESKDVVCDLFIGLPAFFGQLWRGAQIDAAHRGRWPGKSMLGAADRMKPIRRRSVPSLRVLQIVHKERLRTLPKKALPEFLDCGLSHVDPVTKQCRRILSLEP